MNGYGREVAKRYRKVWYRGYQLLYRYSSDTYGLHWYYDPSTGAMTSIPYNILPDVIKNQDKHRRWMEIYPAMTEEEEIEILFNSRNNKIK